MGSLASKRIGPGKPVGLLVFLVLATVTGGAVFSGTASAATAWPYCGRLVDPHSACPIVATSPAIYLNIASYGGSGTVPVCERVITTEGPNTISRRCNATRNIVSSEVDLAPYPSAQKQASVGNDSNFRHTIDGTVYTP